MTHDPHHPHVRSAPPPPAPPPAPPLAPPSPLRLAIAEVTRLRRDLAACRLRCANLLAAIHAALSAAADGEDDPLAYLRDELPDHTPAGEHATVVERGEGGCR